MLLLRARCPLWARAEGSFEESPPKQRESFCSQCRRNTIASMKNLFTNSSEKRDFVENAVTHWGRQSSVQIASAFFSNHEVIEGLVERGCSVMLVVRLGSGTDPRELGKVL